MATFVSAPSRTVVAPRVAPTRAQIGGGSTTTYCYRTADGSLGTTTDISEIPVGAERERTISV